MADQNQEPKGPVSVYQLVTVVLENFTEVAWGKLGLHPDILTGQIETDLVEAKVAIDIVGHLADTLEPQLDDEDKRRIQGMVRDLRLNYVQKSKEVAS